MAKPLLIHETAVPLPAARHGQTALEAGAGDARSAGCDAARRGATGTARAAPAGVPVPAAPR